MDAGDYRVGKEASVAMPQWFPRFRAIKMYPSLPQLGPQLEREGGGGGQPGYIVTANKLMTHLFFTSQ